MEVGNAWIMIKNHAMFILAKYESLFFKVNQNEPDDPIKFLLQ